MCVCVYAQALENVCVYECVHILEWDTHIINTTCNRKGDCRLLKDRRSWPSLPPKGPAKNLCTSSCSQQEREPSWFMQKKDGEREISVFTGSSTWENTRKWSTRGRRNAQVCATATGCSNATPIGWTSLGLASKLGMLKCLQQMSHTNCFISLLHCLFRSSHCINQLQTASSTNPLAYGFSQFERECSFIAATSCESNI